MQCIYLYSPPGVHREILRTSGQCSNLKHDIGDVLEAAKNQTEMEKWTSRGLNEKRRFNTDYMAVSPGAAAFTAEAPEGSRQPS